MEKSLGEKLHGEKETCLSFHGDGGYLFGNGMEKEPGSFGGEGRNDGGERRQNMREIGGVRGIDRLQNAPPLSWNTQRRALCRERGKWFLWRNLDSRGAHEGAGIPNGSCELCLVKGIQKGSSQCYLPLPCERFLICTQGRFNKAASMDMASLEEEIAFAQGEIKALETSSKGGL